jgi:hypothetical protein
MEGMESFHPLGEGMMTNAKIYSSAEGTIKMEDYFSEWRLGQSMDYWREYWAKICIFMD